MRKIALLVVTAAALALVLFPPLRVSRIRKSESSDQRQNCCRKPVPADLALTPGTYQLRWSPDPDAITLATSPKQYSGQEARRRMLKLPKLGSSGARFYASSLDGSTDDGLLAFIVDESAGTGRGYDRIYVDTNRNRDLSDEQPVPARLRAVTAWIRVQAHQGKVSGRCCQNPIEVRFDLRTHSTSDTVPYMYRKGGWTGTINTNKGSIACALMDINSNGIYSDRAQVSNSLDFDPRSPDVLFADLNRFGSLAYDYLGPHRVMLNPVTMVAGRLYDIRPSRVGDSITVAPYSGPTGEFVLSTRRMAALNPQVDIVFICGKSGAYELKGTHAKRVQLPSGRYRLAECWLSLPQTTGQRIILQTRPNVTLTVRAGSPAVAELGAGPIAATIEPDKKVICWNPSRRSRFDWQVSLGDGTAVTRFQSTGDYEARHPTVRFFDKSGRLIHTTRASYG